MKFADELRGSEGERCKVTDLTTGTIHHGFIKKWDDKARLAEVLYDDGTLVRVDFAFVTLTGTDVVV